MGAGLVVFSGGKGIRGPQSSGLVVGRRELVEAARLNSSPWSAIGRGMKVGKEEILALLAAVDLFLSGSDEKDHALWKGRAERIVEALAGSRFRARVGGKGQPAAPDFAPRAYVDLPEDKAERLVRALRDGEPPIVVRRVPGGIVVDPANVALMRRTGMVAWLAAPAAVLAARVGDGAGRPLAGETGTEVAALLASREAAYAAAAHWRVETAGRTPAEIAEEVVRRWSESG